MNYNKLVRDRIPEIIRTRGEEPVIHTASETEYHDALFRKLDEEVQEFREAQSIEEFADVLEVLEAIRVFKGFPEDAIRSEREKKKSERGGFVDRIILESA
jgi:predicted house-cleaning noncanonical NTP pyrophosphatase (MazG superfamily)